jgi:DNA invertase Pin-like site-specific DNA recombinase
MANLPNQKFVVLLRVSTHSQGADGHGVAAQRRDIQIFLDGLNGAADVISELVEVESGASASRPVLEEALQLCRQHRASLLVQKVDRITRDLEVLARIVKDPLVTVRVASLPNADNFQIHLFGCLAAQEKEFISTRTKAALAAAKERGVRLGNPRIAEINSTRKRTARKFAYTHAPLVWSLRNKGRSNQEIAEVLNESGFTTPRGCKFHRSQVSTIIKRTPNPAEALGAAAG